MPSSQLTSLTVSYALGSVNILFLFCLDTTSIEAIEAKINSITTGGGGGIGVDMDALREEFASKLPTDNTIIRIEALEAELNIGAKDSAGELGMSFRSTGGNSNIDVLKRLSKLEKENVDHELRIADLEAKL